MTVEKDFDSEIQARTEATRAALVALAEAIAEAELATGPTPDGGDVALAAALNRVRAAGRARTRIRELVEDMVTEVAEAELDHELLAARRVQPRGASWRELGQALGVSHQALSKRARARGLDPSRTTLDGRPRRGRLVPQPSTRNQAWTAAVAEHRHRLAAESAARKQAPKPNPAPAPPPVTPSTDAGSGAAFWRAQKPG